MRISSVQPFSVILAAESQKKSGAESSFPVASLVTASYWMPRGLARKRMAVRRVCRVSRMTPA